MRGFRIRMYLSDYVPALVFILLSFSSGTAERQDFELSLELCSARLLTPRMDTAVGYDGEDAIYIFGGRSGGSTPMYGIQKYTISTDTIEVVADLNRAKFSGTVSFNKGDGSFFHYGGYTYSKEVVKYDPVSGNVAVVASLPTLKSFSTGVKIQDNSNTVLLLGGTKDPTGILTFDELTFKSSNVGNFSHRFAKVAAVADGRGMAYVFGNEIVPDPTKQYSAAILNLTSYEVNYGPENVPRMLDAPVAVWDGRFGYILCGFANFTQHSPDFGIIRFDPQSMDIEFIPVKNYPGSRFYGTRAVYVEKLDRIYLFGGQASTPSYVYYDNIWYIDLNRKGSQKKLVPAKT